MSQRLSELPDHLRVIAVAFLNDHDAWETSWHLCVVYAPQGVCFNLDWANSGEEPAGFHYSPWGGWEMWVKAKAWRFQLKGKPILPVRKSADFATFLKRYPHFGPSRRAVECPNSKEIFPV